MADYKFWRELARDFRALPEDGMYADQEIGAEPDVIPPFSGVWMLHSNSHHVAMQFEALARYAGDAALPNDTVDSFQVWMNELYSYGLNIQTSNILRALPGELEEGPRAVVVTTTIISNLAETSALLCEAKGIRAFEAERIKKANEAQQNDPRNWSALRQHTEATQAIKAVMTSTPFEITEDFVREAVARHDGIKPEEVTQQRINWEVSGMLPRYPHIRLIPSNQAEPQTDAKPIEETPLTEEVKSTATEATKKKRASATVTNLAAAQRMQEYIESKGLGQDEFADLAHTTARTLLSFRTTGKVRRDIFEDIANAMGITRDELMNSKSPDTGK